MSDDEADFATRQEGDRIHVSGFWMTAGMSIVVIVGAVLISWGILAASSGPPRLALHGPTPLQAPPRIGMVEQRLFGDSGRGRALRAEQEKTLEGWGWVDRGRGVARIPIDRAMGIVAHQPWEAL